MTTDAGLTTDLIDVTGLSLGDLGALPDSAVALALREVLSGDAAPTSAGFSSRLGR